MVASEDKETQRKGIVGIFWGSNKTPDRLATWRLAQVLRTLPLRYAAFHLCFTAAQHSAYGAILALGIVAIESVTRVRVRRHNGE